MKKTLYVLLVLLLLPWSCPALFAGTGPEVFTILSSSSLSDTLSLPLKDLQSYLTRTIPGSEVLQRKTGGKDRLEGHVIVLVDRNDPEIGKLCRTYRLPAAPQGWNSFRILSYSRKDHRGTFIYFLEGADIWGKQYAVYDLAERLLGVRYLKPDLDHVVVQPGFKAFAVNTDIEEPDFKWRGLYPWHYNYNSRGLKGFCDINARFVAKDWKWFCQLCDWMVKNKQNAVLWFDDVFSHENISGQFPASVRDYYAFRGVRQVLGLGWASNEDLTTGGDWKRKICLDKEGKTVEDASWKKSICPMTKEYGMLMDMNFGNLKLDHPENYIGALIGYGENTWASREQGVPCVLHDGVPSSTIMNRDLDRVAEKFREAGLGDLPLGFVTSTHSIHPGNPFETDALIDHLPPNAIFTMHTYQQTGWTQFEGLYERIARRNREEHTDIKVFHIGEVAFLCGADIPLLKPSILRRRSEHFNTLPKENTIGHLATLNTTQYLYWYNTYRMLRWQWHKDGRNWEEDNLDSFTELFGKEYAARLNEIFDRFTCLEYVLPYSELDSLVNTPSDLRPPRQWSRYSQATHPDRFGFLLWAEEKDLFRLEGAMESIDTILRLDRELSGMKDPLYRNEFSGTIRLTAAYYAIRVYYGEYLQYLEKGQPRKARETLDRAAASLDDYNSLLGRLMGTQPGAADRNQDLVWNPTPAFFKAKRAEIDPSVQNDTVIVQGGKPVVFRPFDIQWKNSAASKLNLSYTLEKPAGQDGFLTVRDGHFVKPSGERFRIWGVNLVFEACFPDRTEARMMAAYLARLGVNAVRFHFLDARGLFDPDADNTRSLYALGLDRLDYFIAELKKEGIYTNLNLNVGRSYRPGDGVPEYQRLGIAKGATLFDDRLIELEKEYAAQLLTHVNPYTGNAYTDEPAIGFVELVNENSLVEAWFGDRLCGTTVVDPEAIAPPYGGGGVWADVTPYYARELTRKYNEWLRKRMPPADLRALEKEAGVAPGAEIPRLASKDFAAASTLRFETEAEFIAETERSFYTGMYDYLKKELGVRSLVAANSDHNHYKWGYTLVSNTSMLDYVDGHVYWHDYENYLGEEPGQERWGRKDNLPMVSVPEISTVSRLSRTPVENKPFTVSEINNGSYNDFYTEGIPVAAAYGSLQDWDGFYFFALAHTGPDRWETLSPGGLDLVVDPVRLSNFSAYGLLFRRGDVSPSRTTVYRGYDRKQLLEGIRSAPGEMPFFTEGFSPLTPLVHRTRVASFSRPENRFPAMPGREEIASDTGELTWYADEGNSLVEIATPESEALVGFTGKASRKLKHLSADLSNGFAAVTLTSLGEDPISVARKLLLITTARAGMSGMRWSDGMRKSLVKGSRPVTIETVEGTVTVSGLEGAHSVIVEPLDGAGNPLRSVTVPVREGKAVLEIGKDVTVWYYLTVER